MPTTTRAQNQQQVLSESAVFRAASSPRQFKHVSGISSNILIIFVVPDPCQVLKPDPELEKVLVSVFG